MEDPRIVGHVVSVHGFWLKIELSPETKSSSRATPDGVQQGVAINAFLTFNLGAGTYAIGFISDLEARESYDPTTNKELSLELMKPRRIASVQLLGTVKQIARDQWKQDQWKFDSGITVLPTLDTPAEVANPNVLDAIFAEPRKYNKPQDWVDSKNDAYDSPLEIGHRTGDENTKIKLSFNDLFSRPLAIVGNTGSGKSYTIASLLQKIAETDCLKNKKTDTHIFILDINGEYASAFPRTNNKNTDTREPNEMYLNGEKFGLPAWLMNGEEICDWLLASEAIQEPVLKDWWAIVKSNPDKKVVPYSFLEVAIKKIDNAISWLDAEKIPANAFLQNFGAAKEYIDRAAGNSGNSNLSSSWEKVITAGSGWPALDRFKENNYDVNVNLSENEPYSKPPSDKEIRDALYDLKQKLSDELSNKQDEQNKSAKSADTPFFVAKKEFVSPEFNTDTLENQNDRQIETYLQTLRLRLQTHRNDRRWQSFFNYGEKDGDIDIKCFKSWMEKLGVGTNSGSRISVLDLSMLASEILPFACAILGRLLLESREMLGPDARNQHPWVLVLEEAHNYARPGGTDEDRAHKLSRRAFERVAKEGRKFGLSLIVASQRPSEVSPTIISQCANFISHRLQNPDDIEHFRRIIPRAAQRLLDQVTVLSAGEAIVFGSASHVPSRVQIDLPENEPRSATAAPFAEWQKDDYFPLDKALKNWGLTETEDNGKSESNEVSSTNSPPLSNNDDEVPF